MADMTREKYIAATRLMAHYLQIPRSELLDRVREACNRQRAFFTQGRPWTDHDISMLMTRSIGELARDLNRSEASIIQKRRDILKELSTKAAS